MDILSRKKLTFRRDSSSAFFFLISLVFLFSLYSLFFSTLLLSSSHFTLLLSLYNKLFSDISVFPLYFHLLYFSLSFFFYLLSPLFYLLLPCCLYSSLIAIIFLPSIYLTQLHYISFFSCFNFSSFPYSFTLSLSPLTFSPHYFSTLLSTA